MLTPRFPRARRLVLWSSCLVWLGTVAAAGIGGCQGPDSFLRKDDGIGGVGASGFGGFIGLGGSIGLGGFVGLGGSPGIGGSPGAAGGGAGTGGRPGSGGTVGTGGRGTGGTVVVGTGGGPGAGGRDGGAPDLAGSGGRVGTGGAPGMDAGNDAEGGVVGGTGPCAGLCSPAVTFVMNPQYHSPDILIGSAVCAETLSTVQGGGCSNCEGRTNSINGTTVSVTGWPAQLPAPVRGGFCIQISAGSVAAGSHDYASFFTF